MRTLRLGDNLLGFYDGRGPASASAPIDNWVYDGALSLGICSFAIVDGAEAIVYDTHVSVAHARMIRATLELHPQQRLLRDDGRQEAIECLLGAAVRIVD